MSTVILYTISESTSGLKTATYYQYTVVLAMTSLYITCKNTAAVAAGVEFTSKGSAIKCHGKTDEEC